MNDIRAKVESLRDRIEDSDKMSEEDRTVLLDFSDTLYLLKSEYGDYRHEKLLRHCTRMAEEVGGLAASLEDCEPTEDLVRWINKTYDNENTNHDYRTALRVFGNHVTEGDEIPDTISWVPSGTSNSHDPVPNPSDMLKWDDEVVPMAETCRNSRDSALITGQFDAGARSGELYDLTVGDVTDADHGLRLFVDGKTGQRPVLLIASVPYMQRWLSDHPAGDDPDAPLWSKLNTPEQISYRRFLAIFKDAAKRADVTKPVTPTNFRKSNASWLAEQGMNQAYIEDRQGRKRGSDATAHYVARFGGDAEDEYARMQGVEVDKEEPEPIGPVRCPRCDKETPRHQATCVWCNQALDHAAAKSLEEQEQEVRDTFFRFAQQKPEVVEDLQQARDLTELLDNNPELFGEANEYLEALSSE